MDLAFEIDHRNRRLTMQVNKVHSVRTLALVAKDLGEDADWLADIATDLAALIHEGSDFGSRLAAA